MPMLVALIKGFVIKTWYAQNKSHLQHLLGRTQNIVVIIWVGRN